MSNGAPPPIPGTPAAKKGLSPLAWVAIGCGGLLVVGFVVFMALSVFVFKKGKEMALEATGSDSFQELVEDMKDNPAKTAAELAIRMNPELDLVETDDEAGTITFRNTKTGEEATLNFEDIAAGRFSMTTEEGEFSIDASDAEKSGVTFKGPEGEARFGAGGLGDVPDWVPLYPGATETQSVFHSTTDEVTVVGALSSKTGDDAQQVIDHYEQLFEDQGYKIGMQSIAQGGKVGTITGDLGNGRSLNVVATQQGDETMITINYNVKKP